MRSDSQPDDQPDRDESAADDRWTPGDDERENREHIAETGEPQRDALGNAEGAS